MKLRHNILLAAFLTIAVFSLVAYSACKKDACDNVICLHLGACDGGKCLCPVGYEGDRCEILSRDKFVFTFNGGDTCGTRGYRQYPIYLRAMLEDPRELTMKNFMNDPDDSAVCTIQATDSFTFIGSNNSTTFQGTGKMRHDSLWMTYHVERDTSSYNCNYFGQGLR